MITLGKNYINFKLNNELNAKLLRATLKTLFGEKAVDPYAEAKKTVRLYYITANKRK